ncbi:tetratricopeptide repeat protein, partial [Streptomyces sp. NPDC056464]|uniref:tetratricopeptide repeat protein n=1 Tax=Streptomyces sp. NPDC056464 TaxID=3345828 RepID=UPI0036B401D8
MRIGHVHHVNKVVHFAAPLAPVTWPHRSGSPVPRPADCFQHRAPVEDLTAAMADSQAMVLCQVLTGTGGMGKTQLAAHHARTAWQSGQLDLLVWVTASSRDTIISAYAQTGIEVADADAEDPERAAGRFLHWAETTKRRWLIVLDDLADPADLHGLWPPLSPHGRILVTTRRRDAALTGSGRHRIDIGGFTSEEAAAYLAAVLSAHHREDEPDEIARLAADLGYLPLALAQAAAYLIDLGLECAAYRARLADRTATLPDLLPEKSGLPDDHRSTVAAAWSLSVEHANRLRPHGLARPLLHLASMLDPNGIPTTVLTSPPALTYLSEHRIPYDANARSRPVSVDATTDALRCLDRLSLADLTTETPHRAVRVHALIQRATRESLPADQLDPLARATADALLAAWPEFERDTNLAQSLRSNTDALTHHGQSALYYPAAHSVLFRTGESLGTIGQVTAAIAYFETLVHTTRQCLGPNHSNTLTARTNLACWRGEAGDAAGAATVLTELLEDRVRLLGPDHPDTLATRHKLATWRGWAGDAAGAAAVLAELLEDRVRLLGPDHPDTLETQHDLVSWRGEAGDAAGAAAVLAELLPDQMRVLGPDHPHTLATRNNLAHLRGEAGDAAGAATAFAELLEDRVRLLGPDHPDTLATRHSLAAFQWEAGEAASSAAVLAELLPDQMRVLGPDHPHTLATRNSLAQLRGEAGDAAGAATVLAELLDDRVRVLGPDHPDTLDTRQKLAHWRGEAGDAAGAATVLAELLDDRVRVLGPDHPDT